MKLKSSEQTQNEIAAALEQYDLATEARYEVAKRVRNCPYCDGGWRIYERIIERWGNPYVYATECDCLIDAIKAYRNWLIAKKRYEDLSGQMAPEIDRRRLSWHGGDYGE